MCVDFRCAAFPSPIHRPEGIILHGLLCVRHGHQPDWPLPQHHRHSHPLQRVWRHVQHTLHHPIQPDSGVSAGRGGMGLTADNLLSIDQRKPKQKKERERESWDIYNQKVKKKKIRI